MRTSERGFTLTDLVVVLAIVGVTAAIVLPKLFEATAALRVRAAAGEVVAAFRLARAYAIAHAAKVGVRFETDGPRVTWTLYRDGDGDGVRSADIADGTDPAVERGRPVAHLGTSVRFGFPQGPAPRDPGDPRRRLGRLDDPIRFNNSDIASFTPIGGSTPGTVYLTDGGHHLAAVRVAGRTGRIQVLVYDRDREVWERR